jgi:hypothetical protein
MQASHFLQLEAELFKNDKVEDRGNVTYLVLKRLKFANHLFCSHGELPGLVEHIEAEYFDA